MSTKLNINAINDGSLPLSKLTEGVLPSSGGNLTGNLVTVSTTGAPTANLTQQTHIIQTPLIQTGLPTGSAIQDYCKGLVKTLCTEYLNKSSTKFIGNLNCDTTGTYECFIYNTSLVDSESGLPQYAYGTVRSFTQDYYFSISDYVWEWGSENTIYATADKAIRAHYATYDDVGNYISSSYLKLSGGKMTGNIGFRDPNTSSWAYSTSMFDTTGENTLANICGVKGGNNEVQYVYMGGAYNKPWLKVTPTGGLASPFISKTSGNILASWTRNICNHTAEYYESPSSHNSCVIKTGVPVSTGKLYQMHVYGYNYQAGGQVDFTIGFYMYNGSPLRIYGSSNGTLTNPHYYIGKYTEDEVEKVCVYWTCDDSTTNTQLHYIMVDALDNSSTWSIEEYSTEVAATITNITEASLHERMTLNKTETITGAKTFTGALNINNNLNIGSSYGINFNRNDYNYINIPTGDYSALAISKGGMAGANTLYVMNGSALFPYNNNSNDLGTSTKTWRNVYATNFYGTAQKATMDASGRNIADTYALASTCYGGPEGKFAVGNSDNLIGKALTNSWGIYNG